MVSLTRRRSSAAARGFPRLAGGAAPLDDGAAPRRAARGRRAAAWSCAARHGGRAWRALDHLRDPAARRAARREDARVPHALRGRDRRGRARGLRPRHRVSEGVLPDRDRLRSDHHHHAAAGKLPVVRRAARRGPLRARLLRVRPDRSQRGGKLRCLHVDATRRGARERARLRQRLVAQHAVPRTRRRARRGALPPPRHLGYALRRTGAGGVGEDPETEAAGTRNHTSACPAVHRTRQPSTASQEMQHQEMRSWKPFERRRGYEGEDGSGGRADGGRSRRGEGLRARGSVYRGVRVERLQLGDQRREPAHLERHRRAAGQQLREHAVQLLRVLESVRRRSGDLPRQ